MRQITVIVDGKQHIIEVTDEEFVKYRSLIHVQRWTDEDEVFIDAIRSRLPVDVILDPSRFGSNLS